jgi:D-alanyl-D-alanine carboxypeptidase/D-alanyl-D-alanine-endopeptidase (penicillin-binding protein 4)
MKLGLSLLGLSLLVSLGSHAEASDGASCYVPLSSPEKIKGENISERLPIASVSKLITSYWAIKRLGLDYRFPTQVYVARVSDSLYDLHLEGSRDPYLGAERIHHLISELNKKGITRIRNLTFDESFKFYWSIDDSELNKNLASGFYGPQDPVPEKVRSQLKAYPSLLAGYKKTYQRASASGTRLVESPEFTVQSIEFKPRSEFQQNLSLVRDFQRYAIYSQPLGTLLKEMNRNSNNHAANQIFESLSKESRFSRFAQEQLNLDMKSVVMLNGSGDRVDTNEGAKYNEASCSAMLQILIDLHKTLEEKNSSLARIATVIGSNQGTASALYNNDKTFDSVVAKTGTVNPVVTLGGVASTQKGLVFFMFIMKAKGTGQSWNQGRAEIRKRLVALMDEFDGKVPLHAKSFSFISFDRQSFAEVLTSQKENLK